MLIGTKMFKNEYKLTNIGFVSRKSKYIIIVITIDIPKKLDI